ncbi:Uncharacterized protein QTN25_000192 [Entamoeba marina]
MNTGLVQLIQNAKKEKEIVLRNRKRLSRNDETVVFNAMLSLLVIEGFNVELKKSKKTIHTIKMLIPECIEQPSTGTKLNQKDICELSNGLLTNILAYQPISKENMTTKQLKRTKEAQMNNGILYILNQLGYTFIEKKTKKANVTERLVRISQMIKDDVVITKDDLMELGETFHNIIPDKSMGSFVTITPDFLKSNTIYQPRSSPINIFTALYGDDYQMKVEQENRTNNVSETLSASVSSTLVPEEPIQKPYIVAEGSYTDPYGNGFFQNYYY